MKRFPPHVTELPHDLGDKLPLSELFYSIQGEGRYAGYPAVFLRFKYCNVGCAWCDARFTWDSHQLEPGELLTPEEICKRAVDLVQKSQINPEHVHVVITGGEPLLHQKSIPSLILLFKSRGFAFFEIETNGTIVPSETMIQLISWWNCSPKLSNNGQSSETNCARDAIWTIAATGRADFKFVVTGEADIDEIIRDYLPLVPKESVMLMSEGSTADQQIKDMPRLLEECARLGFRYAPRLHILSWNNKRKK